MLWGAFLVLLPAALVIAGPISFDLAAVTWIAIAHAALFATAGVYLLYYQVMANAGGGNLLLILNGTLFRRRD